MTPMEKINLRLFTQLSPNITVMARAMGISRSGLNLILKGKYKTVRPRNVEKFNKYLKELFDQRLKLSRMIT